MHRLVRGYLVAHGYRETLVQLDAATGAGGGRDAGAGAETSGAEAAIMNDAADIRQRFLAGDVAGVRAILKVRARGPRLASRALRQLRRRLGSAVFSHPHRGFC